MVVVHGRIGVLLEEVQGRVVALGRLEGLQHPTHPAHPCQQLLAEVRAQSCIIGPSVARQYVLLSLRSTA
jgi:hypothetical protein